MKRTFTVTIEGIEGDHAGTVQRYLEDAFPRCCVNVTETTATHAKEREVIEAALGMLAVTGFDYKGEAVYASACREALRRAEELRALMEGKG